MDRRGLVVAVVVLLSLSGCLGTIDASAITWQGDPDNHWHEEVLTVSFDAPAGNDRDFRPLVREALVYWTEHSQQYAGYPVGFHLSSNGEQADIHVEFVEAVRTCGAHSGGNTAGCAPVLTDHRQVDRPVEVEIETGLSDSSTTLVLKHEIGHTLGLDHEDEPAQIMQAKSKLVTPPQTNATDRALPWKTNELGVYIDLDDVSADRREDVERQVGAALHYYMDGAGGTVPSNVTFYRTNSSEDAEVVVRFSASNDCRVGAGSCGTVSGEDPDGDGAQEYYTQLQIVLVDLDTEVVAWHVGRWLGTGFGHDQESEYPDPLKQDTTAEERRSAWWE